MKGENATLETQLDETTRFLKLSQNKEKHLTEGKTIHIRGYKKRYSPKILGKIDFCCHLAV